MLTNNVSPTTAIRGIFRDDQKPNEALDIAKEIERNFLLQKQRQWSFDFINDTPVEGLWQWNNITAAADHDECLVQV